MTQIRSDFTPDGPATSNDCGPTSTLMALRAVGLDLPGFDGAKTAAAIDAARALSGDPSGGVALDAIERIVTQSGGQANVVPGNTAANLASMLDGVKGGQALVLSGNGINSWQKGEAGIADYDGAHYVAVTGHEQTIGPDGVAVDTYIMSDPLSQTGAIRVSEAQLLQYMNDREGGSRGGVLVSNPGAAAV